MTLGHEVTSDAPADRPALLLATGPSEDDVALLVVALASTLRARGVRVGTAEARPGLDGASVLVLTTGAGARIPLPGPADAATLRVRARTIDPALELLIVTGLDEPTLPTVVVSPERAPASPPTSTSGVLAAIHPTDVRRALEDPAHALAALEVVALIEAALLGGPRLQPPIGRASEAPIESARRLLERPDLPPPPRPARGWRRWLGR